MDFPTAATIADECVQQGVGNFVEKKTFLEVKEFEDEIEAERFDRRRRYRSMPEPNCDADDPDAMDGHLAHEMQPASPLSSSLPSVVPPNLRQRPVLLGSRSAALDHAAVDLPVKTTVKNTFIDVQDDTSPKARRTFTCPSGQTLLTSMQEDLSPSPCNEDTEAVRLATGTLSSRFLGGTRLGEETVPQAARRAGSRAGNRRVSFAAEAEEPAPEPERADPVSDDSPQSPRYQRNLNTEDLQDFFEMRARRIESHQSFSTHIPESGLQFTDENTGQLQQESAAKPYQEVPNAPRVESEAAPESAATTPVMAFGDVMAPGAAMPLPPYSAGFPPELGLASPAAGIADWQAAFAKANQALHMRQYAAFFGAAATSPSAATGFSVPQPSTMPAVPMLPPAISTWPYQAVPVPVPVPVPVGYGPPGTRMNFAPGHWPLAPGLSVATAPAPAPPTLPANPAAAAPPVALETAVQLPGLPGSLSSMLPPPAPMPLPPDLAAFQANTRMPTVNGTPGDLSPTFNLTAAPGLCVVEKQQEMQSLSALQRHPWPLGPTVGQPSITDAIKEETSEVPAVQRSIGPEQKTRNARRSPRLWVHIYLHMKAPDFDLVPMLIGRGGCNMRKIAEKTDSKIRIRGQGSGHKEIDGKAEAPTPLMVAVTTHHMDHQHFKEAIRLTLKELITVSRRYIAHCEKHGYEHAAPYYSVGLLPTGMEDQFRDVFDGVPFATAPRNAGRGNVD